MNKHFASPNFLTGLAVFVASAATCHGQAVRVAAQFDLKASFENKPGFGFETSTHGTAFYSSPQQHTLHFRTNDWLATENGIANLSGPTAFPLWLKPNGDYDAATIRGGVLAVNARSLGSRSTLVASDFLVRTASRLHQGPAGVIDSHFAAAGVKIFINQQEASHTVVVPTNEWFILSFVFPEPVNLNGIAASTPPGADARITLLGDPLSFMGRTFEGELGAAVLFSANNGDDEDLLTVCRGVEHALALRYKVKNITPATAEARNASFAAQFRSFNAWGTLLLVR